MTSYSLAAICIRLQHRRSCQNNGFPRAKLARYLRYAVQARAIASRLCHAFASIIVLPAFCGLPVDLGSHMADRLAVVHMRDGGGAERRKLDEILAEHQVQGPIHHDAELLFEPWQLAQINGPPQPPGNEAGEVHSQDIGHPVRLPMAASCPRVLKMKGFSAHHAASRSCCAPAPPWRRACCAVGG